MSIAKSDLDQLTADLQNRRKSAATTLLRKILKRNPNNVQALVWLGGLTEQAREGIIALERALKIEPDHETAQQYLNRWRSLQIGKDLITAQIDDSLDTLSKQRKHRLALLIDGDNARPSLIDQIIPEAQKYGTLQIKRIYGDWTKPAMHRWKRTLHRYGIHPIQQFQYSTGKNATDSALIIDAMDILHTDQVDGYCLVSSDSDYTRLATRIAEDGRFVMGIGKRRTPRAFVNACEIFIYTEDLLDQQAAQTAPNKKQPKPKPKPSPKKTKVKALLKEAFEQAKQPDGRVYLGTLGLYLQRLEPGFEPRKYGYKQLSQLVKAQNGLFETELVESRIYVKLHNNGQG
ncbi:MAG: NYN domain-containing protein [Chloroflexota bacterium]